MVAVRWVRGSQHLQSKTVVLGLMPCTGMHLAAGSGKPQLPLKVARTGRGGDLGF